MAVQGHGTHIVYWLNRTSIKHLVKIGNVGALTTVGERSFHIL